MGASQQEEVTDSGVATGHSKKRSSNWSVKGERSGPLHTPAACPGVRPPATLPGTWAGVASRPVPHAWLTALLLPFFNS